MSKMKRHLEDLEEQLGLTEDELAWIKHGGIEIAAGRSSGPDGDFGAEIAEKLRTRCLELLAQLDLERARADRHEADMHAAEAEARQAQSGRSYQPGCAHCDWTGPTVSSYGESKQLAAEHARECGDSALTERNAALDDHLARAVSAKAAAEKALMTLRTRLYDLAALGDENRSVNPDEIRAILRGDS